MFFYFPVLLGGIALSLLALAMTISGGMLLGAGKTRCRWRLGIGIYPVYLLIFAAGMFIMAERLNTVRLTFAQP